MQNLTSNISSINGLLSPEGVYYDCSYEGHWSLANQICEEKGISVPKMQCAQDHLLFSRGWAKISREYRSEDMAKSWDIYSGSSFDRNWSRLTQKQRDFIFDWCQHHGVDLPSALKPEFEEAA